MTRLMVFVLAVVVAGCGGDSAESFSGECTLGGIDVTTTLDSCDAALEEGRRLVVEHEMAVADAPTSSIDAILAVHCMDWDDFDAQAQRLHDALRAEVCV